MNNYISIPSHLIIDSPIYYSQSNNIDNVFTYLFVSEDNLTEKNLFLFEFIEGRLLDGEIEKVNDFINHTAIIDLHRSLLKTAIILVENIDDSRLSISKINDVYNSKRVF
jgi:hypothetical protein